MRIEQKTIPASSPPVSTLNSTARPDHLNNVASARDQANQLNVDMSATQASSDGIDRLGGATVTN